MTKDSSISRFGFRALSFIHHSSFVLRHSRSEGEFLKALCPRSLTEFSCHSRVAPYLACSTFPRRNDLRTWSRAAGLHRRVRSRRSTMEQQSLLRWKISTPRSINLKDAVSASILKRLKRLCAGWHNFATRTGTNWSFTGEKNDEARLTNAKGSQNALMTKVILECFLVIRISSFLRPSSFVIRHFTDVDIIGACIGLVAIAC